MTTVAIEQIDEMHIFRDIYGLEQTWSYRDSWSFIGNPRKNHGFMYLMCDEAKFRFRDGSTAIFKRGNLLYLPQDTEYYVEFGKSEEKVSDLEVLYSLSDAQGEDYRFADGVICLAENTSYDIISRMSRICEYSKNLKSPYLRTAAEFYSLMDILQNQCMQSKIEKHSSAAIAPALLYINSHISDNISVGELAKMCFLSETAFRKAFFRHCGVTPSRYKTEAKIKKAQELLANAGELSVADVASQLGFYDLSYFYKIYTAYTGTTPSRYRKSVHD